MYTDIYVYINTSPFFGYSTWRLLNEKLKPGSRDRSFLLHPLQNMRCSGLHAKPTKRDPVVTGRDSKDSLLDRISFNLYRRTQMRVDEGPLVEPLKTLRPGSISRDGTLKSSKVDSQPAAGHACWWNPCIYVSVVNMV